MNINWDGDIGLKDVSKRETWLGTVGTWLSASGVDGFDLCSQVEAGVKQEQSEGKGKGLNMFIEWAKPELVKGPATKLFTALAPFAQGV